MLNMQISSSIKLSLNMQISSSIKLSLSAHTCLSQAGEFHFLGDVNARAGKSNDMDDVIGMFEETTCNSNGN